MKRRILSIILAVALMAALVVPASAAQSLSAFSDISDAETAESVEVLRLLGVINGISDTKFDPYSKLTRAQFCKMAIIMLGREEAEPSYRTRTIFSDVTATHWARGYINLAASGEKAIIAGMGNGKFSPDTNITWAQALTILVRILGYTDADTDMQWPEGYIALASNLELTKGISVSANSAMSRGDAAKLFRRLLDCNTKAGARFSASFGSASENVILLDNNARASDGTDGAVATSAGVFKTNRPVQSSFVGLRGCAVLDAAGKLATFIPNSGDSAAITVSAIEAGYVKDSSGKRYTIASATPAYTADEAKTWSELWLNIPVGAGLTLYFSANGTVEAVFFRAASTDKNTAVADAEVKGNPFTSILNGEKNYEVYKNGEPATMKDLRDWDVGEYDSVAKRLNINDFKLTGCFENAYPSPNSPETVTVMGHKFTVLPSAQEYFEKLSVGSPITLLLTSDLRVAGAVAPTVARGEAVGIVTGSTSVKIYTSRGNTLDLQCDSFTTNDYSNLQGELVSVSSYKPREFSVVRLAYAQSLTGKLDLEAKTLANTPLAENVIVFDKYSASKPVKVKLSQITQKTFSKSDILYSHTNWAGKIDMIILNDATGDCYTYGFYRYNKKVTDKNDGTGGKDITITFGVTNHDDGSVDDDVEGTNTNPPSTGLLASIFDGTPVGICYRAERSGKPNMGHYNILSAVRLTRVDNVARADFTTEGDNVYCTIDGTKWLVADNVQCYNKAAGEWFATLDEARAFSSTLTVYYDRPAEQSGKIRLVVAQ